MPLNVDIEKGWKGDYCMYFAQEGTFWGNVDVKFTKIAVDLGAAITEKTGVEWIDLLLRNHAARLVEAYGSAFVAQSETSEYINMAMRHGIDHVWHRTFAGSRLHLCAGN